MNDARIEGLLREVFLEESNEGTYPRDIMRSSEMLLTQRRRRRGWLTAATLAMVVILVSIAGSDIDKRSPRPVAGAPATKTMSVPASLPAQSVTTTGPVKRLLKAARLTGTHSLAIGSTGELRLSPTGQTPRLSKEKAIRIWASAPTGGGLVVAEDPIVFLAAVTLSIHATSPTGLPGALAPSFSNQLAWVVIWMDGPYYCYYSSSVPSLGTADGAPITQVALIAADGSGKGLLFRTGLQPCATVAQADSAVALGYSESLQWTIPAGQSAAVLVTLPPCSSLFTVVAAPSGLVVDAEVWMVGGACRGKASTLVPVADPMSLGHGSVGLLVTRTDAGTATGDLVYFDGQQETLRP